MLEKVVSAVALFIPEPVPADDRARSDPDISADHRSAEDGDIRTDETAGTDLNSGVNVNQRADDSTRVNFCLRVNPAVRVRFRVHLGCESGIKNLDDSTYLFPECLNPVGFALLGAQKRAGAHLKE